MPVLDKDVLTLPSPSNATRSSWDAEGSALVSDILHRKGGPPPVLRLRVFGESMLPALWPGDVVHITSCPPADVRPGEIVLALRDGRLFLHRLLSQDAAGAFLLRGDSIPASDPPFPADAFLGKLVPRRPRFGIKILGAKWSRALGFLFCHCSLARRLALKLHERRTASARTLGSLEAF